MRGGAVKHKYLRIFLFSTLFYGLAMSVVYTRMHFASAPANAWIGVAIGLSSGVLFGAFMTWWLRRADRRVQEQNGGRMLPVRPRVRVDVPVDATSARQACVAALASLRKARIRKADDDVVEAITGLSWESFGEHVTARVEARDAQTARVVIESRPLFFLTLVDLGRNARNLDEVVDHLRETLGDAVRAGALEDTDARVSPDPA